MKALGVLRGKPSSCVSPHAAGAGSAWIWCRCHPRGRYDAHLPSRAAGAASPRAAGLSRTCRRRPSRPWRSRGLVAPGSGRALLLQWGPGCGSIPSRARRAASGEGREQPADPRGPGPGAGSLALHDLPCSALSRRCTLRSDLFLLRAPCFYSSDKNNE